MKDKRWGFKKHISLAELKLLFQQGHMKISPGFFSWLHLAPPLSHAHQEIPKKHLYLSLNFLLPSDHGSWFGITAETAAVLGRWSHFSI